MPKIKEREKAINLRKRGYSYAEILRKVPVAKSTLSLWLRSVGLSKRQKQRLTKKKLESALRGARKRHLMRLKYWQEIKSRASKEINSLSRKERLLMGIVLYWAEGAKEKEYSKPTRIRFSNSDISMIIIFRKWLKEFFKIPENNLRYELYIHEKANWIAAKNLWASKINISTNRINVYFKRHNPKPKRKNINKYYHGLLRITVKNSIDLVRRIDGWIDGICKNWGVV